MVGPILRTALISCCLSQDTCGHLKKSLDTPFTGFSLLFPYISGFMRHGSWLAIVCSLTIKLSL